MSNLYFPYRAIGYVTDGNPFSVNRLGEEIFITTSIGCSFQVYRLNKLVACLVSQKAAGPISAVQVCVCVCVVCVVCVCVCVCCVCERVCVLCV
jgi:hypothetical protein